MTTLLTRARFVHRSHLTLDALGVELPPLDEAHPNRVPFYGVMTRVDEASTRPPNGSQGHRVYIPRAVAEAALPSLIGMPINFSDDLSDHDKTQNVGTITEAAIEGQDVVVRGYLFAKNFPDAVARIQSQRATLGQSYEISDVEVEDVEAPIWTLTHFLFTGAAILRRDAAAYANTSIVARAEEDPTMAAQFEQILEELKKLRTDAGTMRAAADEEDAGRTAEEDAARKETEDARKQADADAARKAEEDAKRDAEEDAARKDDEDAASKDEDEMARMGALFAMLMRGMGYSQAAKREDDAEDAASLLARALRAMSYPGSAPRARHKEDGAHGDEAEDIAMLKRLIKPGAMKAGDDLAARRQSREMTRRLDRIEAAIDLITDTLRTYRGLITDQQHTTKNLSTDQDRGKEGGPVRKTLAGAGEKWAEKDTGGASEQDAAALAHDKALAAIDAEFAAGKIDRTSAMARKLDLVQKKQA